MADQHAHANGKRGEGKGEQGDTMAVFCQVK
jgi:hypothetical protein